MKNLRIILFCVGVILCIISGTIIRENAKEWMNPVSLLGWGFIIYSMCSGGIQKLYLTGRFKFWGNVFYILGVLSFVISIIVMFSPYLIVSQMDAFLLINIFTFLLIFLGYGVKQTNIFAYWIAVFIFSPFIIAMLFLSMLFVGLALVA